MGLTLSVIAGSYSIFKLAPDNPLPPWLSAIEGWFSVTRTPEEVSIVCCGDQIPPTLFETLPPNCMELDWTLIKVNGPLDFALTGILNALTQPLADARIPIFAVSTFDTDYLLVKASQLAKVITVLQHAGHTFSSDCNGIEQGFQF